MGQLTDNIVTRHSGLKYLAINCAHCLGVSYIFPLLIWRNFYAFKNAKNLLTIICSKKVSVH